MKQRPLGWDDMNARMERLEARQFQPARRTLVMLAVSIGLVGTMLAPLVRSATKARLVPVEASEFVLRDANGRVRARLDAPAEMTSAIASNGPAGAQTGYGARLTLFDTKGKARLEFAVDADDAPSIVLNDPGGQRAVEMIFRSDAEINLYSKDLHVVSLTASRESMGSLTIRGPRLGNEIFLGANADSSPGARFYQDGVPRLILGTTSGLRMRDALQTRSVSSFLLLDGAGQVVYSAPDAVKP